MPMKNFIFLLLIAILATSVNSYAQQNVNQELITVNAKDLTPDQLAKIKAEAEVKALESKLQTYGNWVGVGGEIGKGVKDALMAVVDVSDKFGKTDVGKFTLVMVAWKIMGKDVVRILLGLMFLTIAVTFIYKQFKHLTVRRVVKKTNGIKFWQPKEYEFIEPKEFEGINAVKFLYAVLIFASVGVTYAIMFG